LAVLTMLLRASFRHRWRSWLSLCLLIALVSGLTLAATAAGRRSDSAFTRYEAAHGYDAFLYAIKPIPKIATLPVVETSTLVGLPTSGTPTCACSRPISFDDFGVFEVPPKQLTHMVKLESGRMPDQSDPDQVLASFTLAQDDGVHVGTVIRVPFAAPSQRSAVLNNANLRPTGPTVSLRVVGIEASEIEFPYSGSPTYDLYTTSAFARTFNPRTVVLYADFVQLHHGAAGFSQFQTQAKALRGLSITDIDNEAAEIESSIRPQAVGWWILAGLSALVGIVVVVQALVRQATVESEAYATLSALGVSRRQLVLVSLVRTFFVAVVGTVGGIVLAFLVSPLTVVGEVRLADPSTGFVFDVPVLLLGGLAAIVAVLVLGIWPAIRTATSTRLSGADPTLRPSRIVSLLVGIGAPPSALIGVRHALERGRGRNAIPVGSALLGAILAVTALCATAVFGASLTHLTSTPTLYGQPYDEWFSVNQTGYSAQNLQMLSSLEHARGIADITAGLVGNPTIDGVAESGIAGQSLRGPLLATATSGHLPQRPDQVAFGATTLHQLHVHVGSLVRVRVAAAADKKPGTFRVVGTVVFSPGLTTGGLGDGAVFTLRGLLALAGRCQAGPHEQACVVKSVISAGGAFLVRAAPGTPGRVALARLNREYPFDVNYPGPPTNLVNFGQAVNFPLIFGAILVLFGAATLLHVLVVSVTRRRREVGLLKALGFVRRQVALCVSWQTTTVALVGIVIGVPAGIAVGRAVWGLFAHSLGVLAVTEVTAWVMVAVAAATVVVANVLAIGPAIVAARSRPASLLRSE
jgi:ABC-type antimicrobial peptide transport system permease subunit